jgi:hypothetical protein
MESDTGKPHRRLAPPSNDLGLYALIAVFLAIAPFHTDHWLIVRSLSWILAAVIGGRMIGLIAERRGWSTRPGFDQSESTDRLAPLIAGISYASILLLIWGPFSLNSGMGYETGFSYYSETSTWLSGFVDIGDPLRPFTNSFYHTSYLLGVVFGVPGSFVPFQFVYAALWWARAVLLFLILRRILGGCEVICFLAGVFVLVHASDGALQWVGQMNQFGYIFWLLLAVYFFLWAEDASATPVGVYVRTILACTFEFFCLWSYESGLFIIAIFPILLALARWNRVKRMIPIALAWYSVTGAYIYLTVQKYVHSGSGSYQATVMRADWRFAALLDDLLFNIEHSLFFWTWPAAGHMDGSTTVMIVLSVASAAVAVGGGIWIAVRRERAGVAGPLAPDRALVTLLVCGLVVLVASFPAYILLNSARGLWRTQLLSGIGAAIVLVSATGLIFNRAHTGRRWLCYAGCLGVSAAVAYAGAHRAIELGSFHRMRWELQRRLVAQLIRAVPKVKPGTIVFLRDIPRSGDPFGDTMWFDMALRLSYPGTEVSGAYFYTDNAPAPGSTFHIYEDEWLWEEKGYPPLIREAPVSDALIIDYAGGKMQVVDKIPPDMCAEACEMSDYHPESRIIHGKPSVRAINRYGPI